MPACSSLAVVLLAAAQLSVAGAFRRKSGQSSETKRIAGVPVYNYELAYPGLHEAGSEAAFIEVDQEDLQHLEADWVVVMKPGGSDATIEEFCERVPNHKRCISAGHPSEGGVPFAEVHGSEKDLEEMMEGHQDEVEFIEPDLLVHMANPPDDPPAMLEEEAAKNVSIELMASSASSSSWGLGRIGAGTTSASGRGVHVYVLDTGVHTSHRDFGDRAISTLDLTSGSPTECRGSASCAKDRQGHGTHCAGSIAGSSFGVAPEATIHAVKVLSDEGYGQNSWILTALDWLTTKGERPAVASMSLGGSGVSRAEKVAIDAATKAGITVVVAAGNDNADACKFTPAYVKSAITVGATDRYDRRASYSCYGSCVDIWAPGTDITSAAHNSDRGSATMSGTSMACPHVSGAAALVLGENPSMTPPEVRASLLAGAETDVISGLTSRDTNVFLSVSNLPLGGQPVPRPVPRPVPAPAPKPVTGSCPAYASRSYPDADGDCRCSPGTVCYSGRSRGCPYSRRGYRSTTYFSSSCISCQCLRSIFR